MTVLDSSFLMDLTKRLPEAIETQQRIAGGPMRVPYQAALEFVVGYEDHMAALRALKDSYDVVMPTEELLLQASRLYVMAREVGKTPSWADVSIGALAALLEEEIVTADPKAFRALGLQVLEYRPARAR